MRHEFPIEQLARSKQTRFQLRRCRRTLRISRCGSVTMHPFRRIRGTMPRKSALRTLHVLAFGSYVAKR